MQQLQAMRLHFEKILVAREFFRRGGLGWEGQSRRGRGFNLFQQILHPQMMDFRGLEGNSKKPLKNAFEGYLAKPCPASGVE